MNVVLGVIIVLSLCIGYFTGMLVTDIINERKRRKRRERRKRIIETHWKIANELSKWEAEKHEDSRPTQ